MRWVISSRQWTLGELCPLAKASGSSQCVNRVRLEHILLPVPPHARPVRLEHILISVLLHAIFVLLVNFGYRHRCDCGDEVYTTRMRVYTTCE